MRSSYIENNFGEIFYELVRIKSPKTVVELGVLDGYSTTHLADGLLDNAHGSLHAYDLFEDYPFKHSKYEEVKDRLKKYKFVELHKQDAFTVSDLYGNDSVDFLHVDLSNDGEILKKIIEQWLPKISDKGLILFEGGSLERDQVEWMIKYKKKSIKKELESNSEIKKFFKYRTIDAYPSLTILTKTGE